MVVGLVEDPAEGVEVQLHLVSHFEVRQADLKGYQMAKFDPFLSLHCAGVEGEGRNPRKGRDQILQRSVAEP